LVAAAVVPVPGTAADAENLRRQLKLVLSSYKVPRLIVFVDKNDLPLTTTGKVHKDRLRTLLQGMREKGGIVT
jgi:acyl-CoA synthetase (AMP-forming)/AMP-acid ligase II